MCNRESRIINLVVLLCQLLDVQTSKAYDVWWNFLLIILVNEKSMITQNIETGPHYVGSATNLK